MSTIYYMGNLHYEGADRAIIHSGDIEKPIARLYLLKDGWHAKLATVHTRQAWSGPYADPEEAVAHLLGTSVVD
ncbi:hypothetical protein N1027_01400 [Herbiconiux sp. CPCC 205763]|uniref:Uncharacterized protein n=1 Tax=Herbiconiux aconitum TaxID=2970913 RepID=A0ABT2GKN6_9MICO|nr:hypothetical protein [Herbiconiux aconitum]MCS5716786.1 hypothetical protein [Herbiconiux aconitum]